MRQPTEDFRYDPFKVIRPTPMGGADIQGKYANHFGQFKSNTFNSAILKFCSGKCYNLGAAAVENSEADCMNQCTSKYSQAMNSFEAEKSSME